ncbi:putative vacuolar protein sorting-associated protein 13C [Camellia lanceoleosa]|uniref:Vacuolar protein sorting-associated protein 13C n=1 Tax=Camellia lanceoleosa TaxID=1840588 RepID=A0ACC0FQS9_9ERIC|nr:putative vacuolar protein sorting-associated protein 13C [Camellia lanceoleosa]
MFEGLVRQLLVGYLGQYIKDIQKEQLRISLWNEEVLLENVELILEAFDYLQLPFALKQGRVGRLSIKIPWRKLGWDPIIISIEDVFVWACRRDDQEWSMDAVQRREFAGKKAKLAAAELAKLSRRVCDNQAGESFISYITAKILDSIQVSIRNVHVLYRDLLTDSAETVLGIKFSSLTIMKQNLLGFSSGKVRGGQVNKIVEIQGLEVYCSTFQGTLDLMRVDIFVDSELLENARLEGNKYDYILAPVDLSMSLLVSRSGKHENDCPQYSINAELTGLVLSLDEVQFQQVLTLWDYLCICQLREKYGRYRPWSNPLSSKHRGWQKAWWHYAQQSVLSDVRKKLKRTSWKYLGERIDHRRKYVNLYKTKLKCLREEQLIDNDILRELEQMEKEYDIEDILNYRSTAETELQEFLLNSNSSLEVSGASHNDERSSSRARGWLNWLSRGMLGAGGTDDSSQFSGVVSDEVIKDIYEATEFQPAPSPDGTSAADDIIFFSEIKFHIHQVSATLWNMKCARAIAELIFDGMFIECKLWEESAVITALVNSGRMINPCNKQAILLVGKAVFEKDLLETEKTSVSIQVDTSSANQDINLLVKPLEVTYDSEFLLNVMEFYNVLETFKFQHERVMLSLNGIEDVRARLMSKTEYILSSRKRWIWNINFVNVKINIPWRNANSEPYAMVLEMGALFFVSKHEFGSSASGIEDQSYVQRNFTSSICTGDISMGIQLRDLCDHFDIEVDDFEMKIIIPDRPQTIYVLLEKFSTSINLTLCVIPDESILKQLEVYIITPSLHAHFSPSIYGVVLGLLANLDLLLSKRNSVVFPNENSFSIMSGEQTTPKAFRSSIIADVESVSFHIDLENDKENGCILLLNLHKLDIRYVLMELQECWISMKAFKIITYSLEGDKDGQILCSSGNPFSVQYVQQQDRDVEHSNQRENCCDKSTSADGCIRLHYEECRNLNIIFHKYAVCLSDVELHCYPYIVRLLVEFSDKIIQYGTSHAVENSFSTSMNGENSIANPCFGFEKFGSSNFSETGSSEWANIPLDCFPFVTIYNFGCLSDLESSLIRTIPEWRKILKLRERKDGSPKFSVRGSKMSRALPLKSGIGKDAVTMSQNLVGSDVLVDLNLNRIRIHFHDCSCIIGTIFLPTSKSSLSIRGDCLDMLCSTEGLSLCSSWWTHNIHDFLWGPLLTNLPPILNVRVRKQKDGPLKSQIEISFSIQHVSCILPPDFVAIMIGYFELPDWCSKGNERLVMENLRYRGSEQDSVITYKFEILDSTLFTPVEGDDHKFLKLEIPQSYCSFIHNSCSNIVLKDIPPECLVAANKIAERNHCLNVFVRDLSLSLLLLNDDEFDSSVVDQNSGHGYMTFIAQFSANVWVRIPYINDSSCVSSLASTCVMARVDNCQLIAKDGYSFVGFETLLDIIDQFNSVDRISKGFTSDVLQFLQFKKGIKESGAFEPEASTVAVTETRFCVNSLSINFYRPSSDLVSLELLARTDMQFICSGSIKNEKSLFLNASFHSLALFSQLNHFMLAECTSSCQISSVIDIHLSISEQEENELHVFLPSLDIWLHLFDWTELIDLFSSYLGQLAKTSIVDASLKNSMLGLVDQNENVTVNVAESSPQSSGTSSCFASENMKQNAVPLIVKSENIGIKIHIPAWISREAFSIFGEAQVPEERPLNDSCDIDEGVRYNFIALTLQSGRSELVFSSRTAKIKSSLEKINGTVGICIGKTSPSWPFFQFSQFNVEAEFRKNQLDLADVNVEVQCDSLDMWLSYHIFYFWKSMRFKFPEGGSDKDNLSSVDLNIKLKKISLLLTDGRWSSKGPLLEILMRNLLWHVHIAENKLEGSVAGDLQINYNNIHKVLWEPFVEPWKFQLNITRVHEKSALLNSAFMTDIHLTSTAQLNLNVTESLIEAIFRATEMIKDACGVTERKVVSESQRLLNSQIFENIYTGRYAPYILQNLTSLPLVFHVCRGPICADDRGISVLEDGTFVHPGSSIPVYINDDDTPEEQLLRYRPAHSSDRLSDKQLNGVAHNYIVIQFDGTSMRSTPISMDLVGLSYFEVDFSKSSNKIEVDNNGDGSKGNKHVDDANRTDSKGGFVIPVVCDVSVQRYCKLLRLYSTVIFFNATSMPFEVRFDIPFGVSPKILDPIYPGQEFPLPLHLAEAGRVRWRPLGQNYLWSEAHNISNILSQESRVGLLRSFVCYPSHPSSDPFRCCISVQQMCFPSTGKPEQCSAIDINRTVKQSVENCGQFSHNLDKSEKHFIHQVILSSPLVVRNYLPKEISLKIESFGVTRTALLSEAETSFFHIDSSHDLGVIFHVHGFRPSILKFPRAETFSGIAKFSGTKFSLSETIAFDPDLCDGPINVTVEKVMDAFSGAREICIFVPYLLYNCTGFPLIISDCANDMKGHGYVIPSCYDLVEKDHLLGRKDGLGLLSSSQDSQVAESPYDGLRNCSSINRIFSTRKNIDPHLGKLSRKPMISGSSIISLESSDKHDLDAQNASLNRLSSSIQSNLEHSNLEEIECRKVEACMYSPDPNSSVADVMVRVSRYLPECVTEKMPKSSWSSPFFLVQPTGSTNVLVPQLSTNAAYVISVSSSAVAGPFSGRTRAITFQPRYIISNACCKDLCYKQKGTDSIFHLGIGKHSHLQWTDTTRELLVSIRFNEPGWQWSGCFLPDHLGDTQVKMQNHVSGAVSMIRVEVQNADVSIQDEKIVGSLHGDSGTNLIMLSNDDTGFMPYRIDNFSMERVRVYQQRGETFETIIQSYTSCPYAWDEPCYPHRLTVEVPGERIVGSYTLDDVKEYTPVCLPSTSEKPERTLLVSVHAEGAIKVLSIIDSGHHVVNDAKDPRVPQFKEKGKHDQKQETSVDFTEKISIAIPFIGISLMNSHPQELLFACAKNTRIDVLQSLDRQKFSFQISSLQIDNQLPSTPYPVILSFDREYRTNLVGQRRNRDDNTKTKSESLMQITSDSLCDPVFFLAAAKWRNRDVSLVSFEYISLRLTDFHLELEQEVILGLFDFFRTISSRSQVGFLTFMDSTLHPVTSDLGFIKESPAHTEVQKYVELNGVRSHPTNGNQFFENHRSGHLLPSVVPIGAPWQQIYLLARRQKKIYVEMFDLAPIKLTLSFSSTPWTLRNGVLTSGESLIHRGLMALADVEGAQIHLRQLSITHHMASWESIQEIITRHYTRQLLHEMYKVFGSAGVIGNPMGFARSVGIGIKDFLSVPARSIFQSPAGLITGMAQGTTSLLSNTVYAISDTATQFSRAAHKGIVAFTFDAQAVAGMEKQQTGISSHSKGVINEFLEGLTGLLQSPIKGAEKHGLPGVLSGVALGITGLVARPAASILEVTGKTAQSIRNRSKLYHMGPQRLRVRLPRPVNRELPLRPYSWEEAIGSSVLAEADNGLKLKDEHLIMCKALKQGGKFVLITERLILIVDCVSLVNLGKPEFRGIPANPEWVIEADIGIDTVIHADTSEGVVHIVGSSSDPLLRQNQHQFKRGSGSRAKRWNNPPTSLPLYQTNLEFTRNEEAEELLQVLSSAIEQGKERGWGCVQVLHQCNLR